MVDRVRLCPWDVTDEVCISKMATLLKRRINLNWGLPSASCALYIIGLQRVVFVLCGLWKLSRHRLIHLVCNSHAVNLIFRPKRTVRSLRLVPCFVYILNIEIVSDWITLASSVRVSRAPARLGSFNVTDFVGFPRLKAVQLFRARALDVMYIM